MGKTHTVSEVASMTRVSVRALHHYDEMGLLSPSLRSDAGYRLYTTADLERLQRIMTWKLLGFPLEEIRRLLDDPDTNLRAALTEQRAQLIGKLGEVQALVAAIDAMLGDEKMTFDMFATFDPAQYEAEAQASWGHTPAYREAAKRTARYSDDDWTALKKEANDIYVELAAEQQRGAAPTDASVQAIIERHRQHIDRWFYACDVRMHKQLGELYASDVRYGKQIDRARPGLTPFLCAAIAAT